MVIVSLSLMLEQVLKSVEEQRHTLHLKYVGEKSNFLSASYCSLIKICWALFGRNVGTK